METQTQTVSSEEVKSKVKEMYTEVAQKPDGEFHFEMGRALAERLGYEGADLDKIPKEAIDSFAGVGYHFGLAKLKEGERVLDLGSGSGMDTFIASLKVGSTGKVVGVDMTAPQRDKSESLRKRDGFDNITYVAGDIENLDFEDGSFDVVISNGVINLSPEKAKVFQEAARVLAPGGRFAISDIVTEEQLTEKIVCNAELWAACIGGAAQQDSYKGMLEKAGLHVEKFVDNKEYKFLGSGPVWATEKFGVKSSSILAVKKA